MSRTLLPVIGLLSLLFLSCGNNGRQLWSVQNNSSMDLIVQLDATADSYNSETFVPPGNQEVIAAQDLNDGMAVNPVSIINNILIFTNSDSTTKDPRAEANWVLSSGSPDDDPNDLRYTFTVTDDDF